MTVEQVIAAFERGVGDVSLPDYLRDLQAYGASLLKFDAGTGDPQYSGQMAWEVHFGPARFFHIKRGTDGIWRRWAAPQP